MGIGINKSFISTADILITNSAVLQTTTLTSAIAANQTQFLKWWVPFRVGNNGGIRAQILVPAGGTLYLASICLYDTFANAVFADVQNASAVFTNALAGIAPIEHYLKIEATIINGATAGNVDLQMAQNTANASSLRIFRGGVLKVLIP